MDVVSNQGHTVVHEWTTVRMRDGANLRTEIFRPEGEGKFPVLVKRNCYWWYTAAAGARKTHNGLAEMGYVVVVQNSRGSLGSEGDFQPLVTEGEDGYDAIEWAASQPWSNGKVATFGESYLGMVQWQAAKRRPPHLVAMLAVSPANDGFNNWPYHSRGILALETAAVWTFLQSQQNASELDIPHPMRGQFPDPFEEIDPKAAPPNISTDNWSNEGSAPFVQWGDAMSKMMKPLLEHRPLRDLPAFDTVAPWWPDWVDNHDQASAYWRTGDLTGVYGQLSVPVLHVAGWYDLLLGAALRNFQAMTTEAPGEDVRRAQRLVIGPWDHMRTCMFPTGNSYDAEGPNVMGQVGDTEFFENEWQALEDTVGVRFLEHHVREQDNGVDAEPPIRLFVMGENVWRNEWEWPLARTEWTSFALSSSGNANTLDGDGTLTTSEYVGADWDSFDYDPADPVPTIGGARMIGAMPADQRANERRPDVLVYTSDVLASDLEVTGPVSVDIWASSSASDTDFTAMLVDVHPDGTAVILCQGIVRTRYATQSELLLEPGTIYQFKIDLDATSNVFKVGHRIRVDISSSCYPMFDANPNTGLHLFDQADSATQIAHQRIYHSKDHPSRLILPLIPR